MAVILLPADALAMTDAEWEARNVRIRQKHYLADVCSSIGREAERRDLPQSILTRLIWQESRFDAAAVSPKGAQGIAQFMPATARERGLLDPYAVIPALRAAAHFLSDLRAEFGNVGLAAAAYNAGPQRVKDWLDGKRTLPGETRDYVLRVTGLPAHAWTEAEDVALEEPAGDLTQACIALASSKGRLLTKRRPPLSWALNAKPDLLDPAGAAPKRQASHLRTRARSSRDLCANLNSIGATCQRVRR